MANNLSIVCTGYGIKAANTSNIDSFLYNLQKGICCLEVIEGVGPNNESNILGLINDELEECEKDKKLKRLPRVTKLGIIAAKEAIQSAQINIKVKKVGLFFGLSLGNIGDETFQKAAEHILADEYRKIPVTLNHIVNYHSITAQIGAELGVNGVTRSISTGCTSSLEAIEEAMIYLESGKIDVAIVGGTDSPISRGVTYGFARTRVMPFDQPLEQGAVPFQEDSKGFAMSEGSGVIILERKEDAEKRGANIHGEIVNIVSNNDGIYIFSLDEDGEKLKEALAEVTKDRNPDYISSQALGIPINDQIEKRCSAELFNHKIPYTSIKSMYGQPFGAVGIFQVIAALLSVEYNFIPPTIRTTKKGYEEMNIVTETQYKEINEVAITNHGFGGNNCCAYIQKYKA